MPISVAPVSTTTVPSSFICTVQPDDPAVVSHQAADKSLAAHVIGLDRFRPFGIANRLGGAGDRLGHADIGQHLTARSQIAFLEDS